MLFFKQSKLTRLLWVLAAVLVVAVLVGFTFQGIQRIPTLYVQTLRVTNSAEMNAPTDFNGTVNFVDATVTGLFGVADLYPLGYATDNKEIVCGTTATFTETLVITPTGLSTVTYALANQITTPAAGAVFLTVSDPTTSTFVLSSWESDYSAGTTGIAAHYCAVGDQ